MRTLLHIGEIAQLLGTTPKAIRHYEQIGLLAEPERTAAGYRLYNAQDLLRLQRIRRLQALGLSLKHVKIVLGEPKHEHTLRDVLQSLDEELSVQIQELEERRKKIRKLLDENTLDTFDRLPPDSPTFQFVQEHLAEYHSHMSSALWEQETRLYTLIDNFHWSEGHHKAMQEMVQHLVQHITERPEEYQQLLALGERLATLASLPENAPDVEHLAEDFTQYFKKYPFLLELQRLFPQIENPFTHIASDLMNPILSPAQKRVVQELERRISKATKGSSV